MAQEAQESISIDQLSEISIKLTAEKNVDRLLELILDESIRVSGSDAGSIYIIESRDGIRQLVFKYTNNLSVPFPFRSFSMPIDQNSISGSCAMTGSIYNFRNMGDSVALLGIRHNQSYDQEYGYHTCNRLVIPLKNYTNDIIGVLQLINKKIDPSYRFKPYADDFASHVRPYTFQDERIVSALASQAAILIERSILFNDIELQLHSFIESLVTALDARDPITAGHSKRVTQYAMRLAQCINRMEFGPYANIQLTTDELDELNIASLLHDVGKIGVREQILMKRNKLSDEGMAALQARLGWMEALFELKRLKGILTPEEEAVEAGLDACRRLFEEINASGFLDPEHRERLEAAHRVVFRDLAGREYRLLGDDEYRNLIVPRGNLTEAERNEINSHVNKSFDILSEIRWTKNLQLVPALAGSHHEKPNGSGYPHGFRRDQLDIRARIMAIADVYDALTAQDRPYKPAIPVDKSLAILREEGTRNGLDPDLVDLFIEMKAYELEMEPAAEPEA